MNWFEYLECAVLPCIAIVEIIVLTLLYRHRNKERNRHQTYLIASLCLSELNGVVAIIFTHIIFGRISLLVEAIAWFYIHCFVRLTYYSTITTLTLDRFLVFYWIIRYLIVWPAEKLLKYLVFTYVISFIIWCCFMFLFVFRLIEWIQVYQIMFIPYFIWDMMYMIYILYKLLLHIFTFFGNTRKTKKLWKNKQIN